jgi:multidrug efflux pump subunit AcrA (membrane-fusion protein)
MLVQTIPDALVIPASSLLTAQDGTASVMLIGTDDRAHEKKVKVGVKQGDQIQIVEGLQAGDKVVSEGAYGLPDNSKIEIQQPGQNQPPATEPTKKSQDQDDK